MMLPRWSAGSGFFWMLIWIGWDASLVVAGDFELKMGLLGFWESLRVCVFFLV